MKFGEVKETKEFDKILYTGFTGIKEVVAINPSAVELGKLYGFEPDPEKGEPKYEGKLPYGDGEDYVDIKFYVKLTGIEGIHSIKIQLVDKEVVSEKSGNLQYVNQLGGSFYIKDLKDALDFNVKLQECEWEKGNPKPVSVKNIMDLEVRHAIEGEAMLMSFIKAWFSGVWFTGKSAAETNILVDKKKMFRNVEKWVDSELRPMIGSPRVGQEFFGLQIVKRSEKNDKVSYYQEWYKEFWKSIDNIKGAIQSGNWDTDKLKKAKNGITGGMGKKLYTLGWAQKFNEKSHINAGNETFVDESKTADTGSGSENVDTSW